LILLIDTALETASVGLCRDGEVIAFRENARQSDHASWLHPAIQEMMQAGGHQMSDLQAVAVTGGPGSYTGLRVGMAAAKGICYAQQIPLISLSTLQVLAAGVRDEAKGVIIALIDARRDEVYAGVYDKNIEPLQAEQAIVLNENAVLPWREKNDTIMTGNGAAKAVKLLGIKELLVLASKNSILNMAWMATKSWGKKDFADLVYHEPAYLKEFYNAAKDRL